MKSRVWQFAILIGVTILGAREAFGAGTCVRNADGTGKITVTLNGISAGTEIKSENTTDAKGPYKTGVVTGNGEHCIDLSKGFVTALSMDVGDTIRLTAGTFSKDCTVTAPSSDLEFGAGEQCQVADIPTVSEWGIAVMALLVLTAATVVIMRRRAATAGG